MIEGADGARSDWIIVGSRLTSRAVLDELEGELVSAAAAFHVESPLEAGISAQLLRSRLRANSELVDAALGRAIDEGKLSLVGGVVQTAGWSPQLAGSDVDLARSVRLRLEAAGFEPPSVEELSAEVGRDAAGVVRFLERAGEVVQIRTKSVLYVTESQVTSRAASRGAGRRGGAESVGVARGVGAVEEVFDPISGVQRSGRVHKSACNRAGVEGELNTYGTWNSTLRLA